MEFRVRTRDPPTKFQGVVPAKPLPMLWRVCSRVGAKIRQLPRDARRLASTMRRRVSDLSDSLSDSWKTPRRPSSPRSPRTPSKAVDHPRAARWIKREEEIKQADEDPRARARTGNSTKGDKKTDCIYTITIDRKVAYTGQTNDFEKREKQHKQGLFVEMKAKNPASEVTMQIVHGGSKSKPNKHPNVLISNKGPQLDAMEDFYMGFYGTLAIEGDDAGEGVNKHRWNKKRAPRTKSDAYVAHIMHLHKCDGPSSEPCDGDERWTPESIATMIESVEATRDDEGVAREQSRQR